MLHCCLLKCCDVSFSKAYSAKKLNEGEFKAQRKGKEDEGQVRKTKCI
jgi:hypothetical protein